MAVPDGFGTVSQRLQQNHSSRAAKGSAGLLGMDHMSLVFAWLTVAGDERLQRPPEAPDDNAACVRGVAPACHDACVGFTSLCPSFEYDFAQGSCHVGWQRVGRCQLLRQRADVRLLAAIACLFVMRDTICFGKDIRSDRNIFTAGAQLEFQSEVSQVTR